MTPTTTHAFLGMLVFDDQGRVQDADEAVRQALEPAQLRKLGEALRGGKRGARTAPTWGHREVKLRDLKVRARLLRDAASGQTFAFVGLPARPVSLAALTPRQREVVRLVGEGRSDAQIGRRLKIAAATVRWHLTTIFRKTGLSSRDDVRAAVNAPPR